MNNGPQETQEFLMFEMDLEEDSTSKEESQVESKEQSREKSELGCKRVNESTIIKDVLVSAPPTFLSQAPNQPKGGPVILDGDMGENFELQKANFFAILKKEADKYPVFSPKDEDKWAPRKERVKY
tara:strand:+ start:66682 stop:67059 length:378 start_codon:yes stop_codon:yes gene_type:complete